MSYTRHLYMTLPLNKSARDKNMFLSQELSEIQFPGYIWDRRMCELPCRYKYMIEFSCFQMYFTGKAYIYINIVV